jgi:hypothetical protein
MSWITQHYELLFGGFGTVIIVSIIGFVWRRWIRQPGEQTPRISLNKSQRVSQNVSQNFSPTINIHPPSAPTPSAPISVPLPKKEIRKQPNITCSRVRLCATTRLDEDGGLFMEVPVGGMACAVATFYNHMASRGDQIQGAINVKARMKFYAGDKIQCSEEIAFGTWIDRKTNWVDLWPEDSRDLLIAVRMSPRSIGLIEDRREPIAADYQETAFKKELPGEEFDVQVRLTFEDEHHAMSFEEFWFQIILTEDTMIFRRINPYTRNTSPRT